MLNLSGWSGLARCQLGMACSRCPPIVGVAAETSRAWLRAHDSGADVFTQGVRPLCETTRRRGRFRREMLMTRHSRFPFIVIGAALILALAGCGAANATGSAHSSSGAGGAALVKTRTITVAGKPTKVLTTASGRTLYWFSIDTPTATHCSVSCATVWPPLLAPGTTVTTPPGLPGHLTVVQDALGNQVAYNGYLLYTYVADTAPGQAHGEGLRLNGGLWWVARPSLSPRSAVGGSAPTSSSSSSSGGGYGG